MRTAVFALWAVLLSSAAYGQSPQIYIVASRCLNDPTNPLRVWFGAGTVTSFEIQARAPMGAQAFEFSIPGFAGVFVAPVPNPEAAFVEGNPFAEGARISFANCQSTPVTLYTVTVFAGQDYAVTWTVAPHSSPSEPGTTCATASLCGAGSASCVLAGQARLIELPPYDPSPAVGATGVSLHPALGFNYQTGSCFCFSVPCVTLYFGEDPDPPVFHSLCDVPFPDLNLKPSTTYYWRVTVYFCGYVFGPVWSFTTAPPLGVEAANWSSMKQIFR